ncbi:PAS domain-containing sensor histidine kinase [Kordiimonas sediminis]|uniref:histidine kinase n=1 Tax=Kordiimonas sediminis TaxID=1735581 RepID=A0A919AVZ8_9PROT|nr:ATP-binding protein [Kordiimonas sediminis]GHF28238.1 PAS domain-containing sensor histidine kinase [Kordiimonas sediminis]
MGGDLVDLESEILHGLTQAVVLISPNNRIEDVFAQTEHIFQRSKESLKGKAIDLLPGVGGKALELVSRSRAEDIPLNSYDVRCRPVIGDIELVDLHANPYMSTGKVILSIQPRRITAFLEKRDDVEAAARSVRGLAAMLAHEIKNPLSGIRGAAQLLGRGGDTASLKMTELICKEVDRIKSLVEQLEDFGSGVQGDYGQVNIHEVLDHVLNLATAGFAKDDIIIPRFDPSLPPVYGDFDQLVQVFLNLIKNASEVSENKSEITITTGYKHGIWLTNSQGQRVRLPVEITVMDRGPGIPEDLRAHLFDPFVSGKEGGSGLGLALVAGFVSEMGGTVTADNRAGGGAIFKVQLALADEGAEMAKGLKE